MSLYASAVLADSLQMVLLIVAVGAIMDTIVSIFYYLTFGTILFFNRINVFGPRQIKKTILTWFSEAVPFLNFLPWFVIGTYLTIRDSDKEDEEMRLQAHKTTIDSLNPNPPTNKIPSRPKISGEVIKKVAIILLCLLPLGALADTNIITTPDLTIKITPRDPAPNTSTTINLISYSFDLDRARIDWQVDGKPIYNNNDQHLTVTTGKLGIPLTIKAQITPANSPTKTATILIIPTQVDLIWRGNTYTPPGYLGGRRISLESTGQVTALPTIMDQTKKLIPIEQLIYTWTDNNKVITPASGLGKNTYTFKAPIGGTKEIKVEVENLDGSLRASNSTLIPVTKPQLLFYEEQALTGPNYAQALQTNFSFNQEQSVIRLVPYFFPQNLVTGTNLVYQWLLNGQLIGNNSPSLGVENSQTPGVASLEARVTNPDSLFQNAKLLLNITLGNVNGSNF